MVEDLSASVSSLASASSFELLSDDDSQGHRVFSEESDDEIVYSISEVSDTEADDEFVVLRRAPQRAHVLATPVGRRVDPKDVPLPLHEEEDKGEESLPSASEPDSEARSHTPSTADGLVSDVEGLSLTGDEGESPTVAEVATPITVPDPIFSGANTAPTNVLRQSDHVVAAAGIPSTSSQKLPSLPDRSLLREQLKVATTNLEANTTPASTSKKPKKSKKSKNQSTEAAKKVKEQKKARKTAKEAAEKEAAENLGVTRELILELTEAERLRLIRQKEAKVAKLTAKHTLTKGEKKSKKAAEKTIRDAKASNATLMEKLDKKVTRRAAKTATKNAAKNAAKTASTVASTPSPTNAAAPAGLSSRGIVDDLSERFSSRISSAASSEPSSPIEGSIYEEAIGYIDTFLSNPEARENSACRLALLQALIIELGLASSVLPTSLKAAKGYLKSRVFVNIKEYLSVRKQGLPALQKIMYPSRKALIKDLRKKRSATPLKMVKDSGLQVLLVDCHFH